MNGNKMFVFFSYIFKGEEQVEGVTREAGLSGGCGEHYWVAHINPGNPKVK